VESNRLLVKMMMQEGMDYPVHLGITEAGEGDDGRIISAAGIGTLLAEGIGDTVRVSLSEAPEREISVAREIIRFIGGDAGRIAKTCEAPVAPERQERYMPEVVTESDGVFCNEKGEKPAGKVFTFRAEDICPDLPAGSEQVILNPVFDEDDAVRLHTDAAALLGRFFIARSVQGLCISNRGKVQGEALRELSFAILQATEARITRTRYISCPTCGRTKFNLEEAVRRVKTATSHLTGMKIAVMGCIVNGPGEMAGADYGYVGAGEGKVHIYRGTMAVMKNIPEEDALSRLLELIERDQTSL
ncbi:MAG: flavodoxin-dependent (E)-4-hydroxy-3-methylbut-2-enyl-diphosphate synthase, partial [Bacteroidales bacterium]|nr:flavodoxin-dependent (E)-4-hydroxy-3-methylbut-2-enyl-diphosphate synthase [Bacteroidales bacterium]